MPLMKFGAIGKIVIIVVALVLAVWILDLCARIWRKMRNKEPVKTAMAKVVFKEIQTNTLDNSCIYSVCLLTVEGKPVELYLNETDYNGLEVGQKGALTYQGSSLIRFEENQ